MSKPIHLNEKAQQEARRVSSESLAAVHTFDWPLTSSRHEVLHQTAIALWEAGYRAAIRDMASPDKCPICGRIEDHTHGNGNDGHGSRRS